MIFEPSRIGDVIIGVPHASWRGVGLSTARAISQGERRVTVLLRENKGFSYNCVISCKGNLIKDISVLGFKNIQVLTVQCCHIANQVSCNCVTIIRSSALLHIVA
jgi:hypothetical protein